MDSWINFQQWNELPQHLAWISNTGMNSKHREWILSTWHELQTLDWTLNTAVNSKLSETPAKISGCTFVKFIIKKKSRKWQHHGHAVLWQLNAAFTVTQPATQLTFTKKENLCVRNCESRIINRYKELTINSFGSEFHFFIVLGKNEFWNRFLLVWNVDGICHTSHYC